MKENYKAWNIVIEDFFELSSEEEKIKFILGFAVLAPSSHNTQPWRFSLKENVVYVYREVSRRLPIADNNDRQLFLSIGCAIENILVAADYFGYRVAVEYVLELSTTHLVAKIKLTKNQKNLSINTTHLIHSILIRKTNRNKYALKPIDDRILNELSSLQDEQIQIKIIADIKKISELADIAILSSIESMIDKDFRYELSAHLKHNLTRSKVGMPGFTLGLPTPFSFVLPIIMRRFNMEKIAQKQNEILFKKNTPYIVLISTKDDDVRNWLEAGRLFQRFALVATKYSISLSPWGAPIQIGNFYKNIQEISESAYRPQLFFRMGYAVKSVKPSPRFSVEDLIR